MEPGRLKVAQEEQVLRFGILLISLVSFGSVTPSLAQSMEVQEYYFNAVENAWKPLPVHELPKAHQLPEAHDSGEFVKLMLLQEYHFNSANNAWEPVAAPASALRATRYYDPDGLAVENYAGER
jgi:hypothetical protein